MQVLKQKHSPRPLRLLAATIAVAMAAVAAQTASAQDQPAPGWRGAPGAGGPGPQMRQGPGMNRQAMAERMLNAVHATPEQRAKIKQIRQAARADLMAQRDSGRKLQQQMMALFAQPEIDAAAAETLRQQISALRDQASKRVLQARIDAARVLTAEQRKTLADGLAKRRAVLERYRADREALRWPAPR